MDPPSPGTSPVKKFTHTKADTRKERSYATHKGVVVMSLPDFGKSCLNCPPCNVVALVAKKASSSRNMVRDAM
jgi:hypothetical protein